MPPNNNAYCYIQFDSPLYLHHNKFVLGESDHEYFLF